MLPQKLGLRKRRKDMQDRRAGRKGALVIPLQKDSHHAHKQRAKDGQPKAEACACNHAHTAAENSDLPHSHSTWNSMYYRQV